MWSADGRTLFFLSNRGGSVDLWQQRITEEGLPDGEPRPLTVGVGMRAATLSADGRTLAYARGRPSPTSGECRFSRTARPAGKMPTS